MAGLSIFRNIVESIKNTDFHSTMVDQTSGVSDKEQAIFCICWVDENLFLYEDFLGLYEMEKTNAINKDNLSRKIRAPTKIEEFFGGKAAPEHAMLYSTIVEHILDP